MLLSSSFCILSKTLIRRSKMNNQNNNRFTTGLFDTRESAEKAYADAIEKGYKPEEITVLMSDESRKKYYDSELVQMQDGNKAMEGMAVGGAAGAVIGGTLAAIAAMGTSLVLPGLGLIVAGPLAAGIAGAGAGSVTGGLIGSLVGWGIPEERAKFYEKGIKSGGIVLGVEDKNNVNLENSWSKYHNSNF